MGEEIAPKCEKCNKRLWNHSSMPGREVCECGGNKIFKPGILEKATFDEQWPKKRTTNQKEPLNNNNYKVKLWCKDRAMGLPECAAQCGNCEYELSKAIGQYEPPKPTFIDRLQEKALNGGVRLYTEAEIKEALPSDEQIKEMFTTEHFHHEQGRYYKIKKDRIQGGKVIRDFIKQQLDNVPRKTT